MLTVNKLIPQSRGLSAVLLKRAATVELDWDLRQKSRFDAVDSAGRSVGVFLPRGSVVRGGDTLVAEDGSLIHVKAALQPVLVVRACSQSGGQHGTPFDLMRAAYHLGNRHVALALQPDRLLLEPDHVLADLLRSMHLIVTEEQTAFEPESGAYAAGHGHGHDHGRDHAHTEATGTVHAQAHVHADALADAHAPGDATDRAHDRAHDQAHGHSHDHGHTHSQANPAPQAQGVAQAAAQAAAPDNRKPLPIPVKVEAAAHVHGPGCGHGAHGHHRHGD